MMPHSLLAFLCCVTRLLMRGSSLTLPLQAIIVGCAVRQVHKGLRAQKEHFNEIAAFLTVDRTMMSQKVQAWRASRPQLILAVVDAIKRQMPSYWARFLHASASAFPLPNIASRVEQGQSLASVANSDMVYFKINMLHFSVIARTCINGMRWPSDNISILVQVL